HIARGFSAERAIDDRPIPKRSDRVTLFDAAQHPSTSIVESAPIFGELLDCVQRIGEPEKKPVYRGEIAFGPPTPDWGQKLEITVSELAVDRPKQPRVELELVPTGSDNASEQLLLGGRKLGEHLEPGAGTERLLHVRSRMRKADSFGQSHRLRAHWLPVFV